MTTLFSSGVLEKRWKCMRSMVTTWAASWKASGNISVFENAIPDPVGAGFFMEQAFVFQGLLSVNHGIESLVLDLHEFGGIVGKRGRLGYAPRRPARPDSAL